MNPMPEHSPKPLPFLMVTQVWTCGLCGNTSVHQHSVPRHGQVYFWDIPQDWSLIGGTLVCANHVITISPNTLEHADV